MLSVEWVGVGKGCDGCDGDVDCDCDMDCDGDTDGSTASLDF